MSAHVNEPLRAGVLRELGASPAQVEELLAYSEPAFAAHGTLPVFPIADEPFIAVWNEYAREAQVVGAAATLERHFPQFRFPIVEGISQTDAYRAVTARGDLDAAPAAGSVPSFRHPEQIRLFVHPTTAGAVPVIVADDRDDFTYLVRVLSRRNEPAPVPASMGACIVAGYNNWERVTAIRSEWAAARGSDSPEEWATEFSALIPQKARYQDRFIVLSTGPYSATPAAAVGLDSETWRRQSLAIRLEHECAHYFTRRVFGSMRNSLHDELIADYAGIVGAIGRYRASWFLQFLGLEQAPGYRPGGRLENYRGTPPLSDGAFTILAALVVRAATALEQFDAARPRAADRKSDVSHVIVALAQLALEELGSADAVERLTTAHERVRSSWVERAVDGSIDESTDRPHERPLVLCGST